MANSKTAKGGGLTTGTAIVIGVFALVLVGVLYLQFGPSERSASPAKRGGARRTPAVAAVKPPAATTVSKKNQADTAPLAEMSAVVDAARWQSPRLAEVVAFDPLAVPDTFPKPKPIDAKTGKGDGLVDAAEADDAKKMAEAIAQLQLQLRELEQRGVQVIVRERDQYAAMIGDRVVHVGDEIDGFTVTVIDPTSGVRVERKSTQ